MQTVSVSFRRVFDKRVQYIGEKSPYGYQDIYVL